LHLQYATTEGNYLQITVDSDQKKEGREKGWETLCVWAGQGRTTGQARCGVRGCFSGLKRANFCPKNLDFCVKIPDFGAKNHEMQTLPEASKKTHR
jgi:hypothetical protein